MAERAIPGVDTGWMAPDGTFFGDRDCDGRAKWLADAYVGVEGVAQRVTSLTDTPETWEAVAARLDAWFLPPNECACEGNPRCSACLKEALRAAIIGEDAT